MIEGLLFVCRMGVGDRGTAVDLRLVLSPLVLSLALASTLVGGCPASTFDVAIGVHLRIVFFWGGAHKKKVFAHKKSVCVRRSSLKENPPTILPTLGAHVGFEGRAWVLVGRLGAPENN